MTEKGGPPFSDDPGVFFQAQNRPGIATEKAHNEKRKDAEMRCVAICFFHFSFGLLVGARAIHTQPCQTGFQRHHVLAAIIFHPRHDAGPGSAHGQVAPVVRPWLCMAAHGWPFAGHGGSWPDMA